MKKIKLLWILILLLPLPVFALEECKNPMLARDSPCLLLLSYNESCNLNVTIYQNATLLSSKAMSNFSKFICNATFDLKGIGTYTFFYNNSATGSLTIEEDVNAEYYLYIVVFIVFIFLMWLGYSLQESTPITIAGFLLGIIALDLFLNGFPNLDDNFLKNTFVIVLSGLSFFLMVAPDIEEIQRLF